MNLLQDIRTAIRLTSTVRRARKAGAAGIQVKPVYTVPCVTFKPAWLNTIEGGQTWKLGRDIDRAVSKVFYGLPYETQRQLESEPREPGGWAERAHFWQEQLRPVLPPETYHRVMLMLIPWYAHCLREKHKTQALAASAAQEAED